MMIRLPSVRNIRDFSEYGYEGCIRSAHLHALTQKDGAILRDQYGLRTVIDLRTSEEAAEKPDAKIPGVAYLHIPIFEGPVPGISHEQQTDEEMEGQPEEQRIPPLPNMPELYRLLATEEIYVNQFRKVMSVINDPNREGGILWHCSEGKDRCGMVSALFLLGRGVDREQVMKDYLLTNRANLAKAWKYYFLMRLAKKDHAAAAVVRDIFLAKREYMEPILDKLASLATE